MSFILSNQESPWLSPYFWFSSVANKAIFIPFHVTTPITATKISMKHANASGNIDVGIYDLDGTRRVSSGSTAMTASNLYEVVSLADEILTIGRYYMALAINGVYPIYKLGSHSDDHIPGLLIGMKVQTSAFPLPSTATLADPEGNDTSIPYMSVHFEV